MLSLLSTLKKEAPGSSKQWYSHSKPHGITFPNKVILIVTAARTSNHTSDILLYHAVYKLLGNSDLRFPTFSVHFFWSPGTSPLYAMHKLPHFSVSQFRVLPACVQVCCVLFAVYVYKLVYLHLTV
jgi:hypothetical protein